MGRIKSVLKYFLLGTTTLLLISWAKVNLATFSPSPVFALTPTNITQISPTELRNTAQSLTNQGHEQLAVGEAEAALKNWQKAREIYTELDYEEGIIGSQINQSLALKALGRYRWACNLLLTATKLDYQNTQVCKQPQEREEDKSNSLEEQLNKQDNSSINAIALRNLGDMLRLIGNLNESKLVLDKSLEMATQLNLSPEISATQLSLGNTQYALYKRQQDLSDRTDSETDRDRAIDEFAHNSLDCYQKVSEYLSSLKTQEVDRNISKTTEIEAKLNQLSLLLDLKDWLQEKNSKEDAPEVRNKLSKIESKIPPLVNELLAQPDLFSDLPAIAAIYNRLNFALSLQQLQQEDKLPVAIQYANEALQQAEEIKNKRSEAYALGILGKLYQATDETLAQTSTEKALRLAQSIQALDIAYQWQYQLGQIYEKRGEMKNARAAYKGAVDTLDLVRKDLLSINPDVQFSFRENVKPVYDKFISLLLQSEESQDNLQQITEVNGKLQLAELENFLRCGSLNLKPINKLENPPDAVIHIIVIEEQNKLAEQNKVAVIVNLPKQSPSNQYHYYDFPLSEINASVNVLRENLQNPTPKQVKIDRDILPDAQKLYNLLIAPAKPYLPAEGTLVFVLDSSLQNIPMSLLQDENKHYLIEKYSITLSLGSSLQEPKFLLWEESNALIAGASKGKSFDEEPKFNPLPNVENELNKVKENTYQSKLLFNETFTKENFQNLLNQSTFPIVHLATHGKFSSNPEETVILASDTRINVTQLHRLIKQRNENSSATIELLVLSACQTAKGDKQSGLGLAGIAVQAGARSTVASLWNVSDKSTAEFMGKFYQNLKAGKTKAEALRQAQLDFLQNPQQNPEYKNYKHPYYWAAFILVGSWL